MQNFRKINGILFWDQSRNLIVTMGNVSSVPLKVRSGSLNAQWIWAYLPVPGLRKKILTIPTDKVGPDKI